MSKKYIIKRRYNDDLVVYGYKAMKRNVIDLDDAIIGYCYGDDYGYVKHNNQVIRVTRNSERLGK